MAAVVSADLVVFHGLKFEGKLSEALEKARGSKVRTYAACSILPAKRLLSSEEGDGIHPDPHVWFDPDLWSASNLPRHFQERVHHVATPFIDLFRSYHEWRAESKNILTSAGGENPALE